MKVGRNDPCPCGSGKKYKKCCLEADQRAGAGTRQRPEIAGEARRTNAAAEEWEADVVPLPGSLGEDPTSRPGVVLVMAAGFVVHGDSLDRPSPEPEKLAATLEAALTAAAEKAGKPPRRLRVRHPELARALAARLVSRATAPGVEVETGCIHDLEEAAFDMLASFSRGAPGPAWRSFPCRPDTWAAWDLPEALVARIFRAAAAFYRAAPWSVHANLDALEATTTAGRTWTACILGQGGEEYGLALYSEPADFWRLAAAPGRSGEWVDDLTGCVVSVLLEPGQLLHRALRREVAAAGWELAGPEAYPSAVTINTPAGGLLQAHAQDLAGILEAVPRFVAAHPDAVARARPIEGWRDPATGVALTFHAVAQRQEPLPGDPRRAPSARGPRARRAQATPAPDLALAAAHDTLDAVRASAS